MVAITLALLLGVAALVIDYGFLAWQRRSLQNAADAAALAAAWELPDASVTLRAEEYANKHVENSYKNAEKVNNDRSVKVEVEKNYDRLFGRIFGTEQYVIRATATAEKYLIGSFDLLPIADIDTYKDPDIKDNERTPENDPVHFEMISKTITEYSDYMKTRIGDQIAFREDNGNIKGNVGLLNLEDFSEGKNIKEIVRKRLNKPIYNTISHTGANIDVKTGTVDSIEKSENDLSKRLKADGWRAYVLAVLPGKAIQLTGSKLDINWGEYLLLYMEEMEVDIENKSAPIKGKLRAVYNLSAQEYPNMFSEVGDQKVRLIK